MKTAIYTRVSTEDQVREGYSLEVQKEYLLNYARQQGFEVYEVYTDEGISAGTTDRPALQKLLKDAKQNKFDLVIVYKIDRFSRRLKDLLDLVEQLETFSVGFKSATEPFDTTTSAGKLMFQQLGSFAEFERNRLAERVFPGMVKSVLNGNWHGSRYSPFGYTYDKTNKTLVINETEAKVVGLIYKMYLAGKSLNEIAEYLNRSKHETRVGKFFYSKFIRDILRSRIYIGQIVWNKCHYDKKQKTGKHYKYVKNDPSQVIVAQGRHKPIITVEDFENVQKLMAERGNPIRKSRKGSFPLTGLLFCEKCNHHYFGVSSISNHRTGERGRWYRCCGRQQNYVRCNNLSIKADLAEEMLLTVIQNMLGSDRLEDNRWLCVTDGQNEQNPAATYDKLKDLKNAVKLNQEQQLKLTDLYLKNLLSEETFTQKNESLRQQEEELRTKLAGLEILLLEKENSADYLERVKRFLTDYDPEQKEFATAAQKEILGLVFRKIIIKSGPEKSAAARIAPSYYSPFDKMVSEGREEEKCRRRRKITAATSSRLSAAR